VSQTIPTQGQPYYSLTTRLDGTDYKLEFTYSTRAERFYLDIYSAEDVLLVAGLKLVTGVFLLGYWHHIGGMPPGEIVVTSTTSDDTSPSLLELGPGKRCLLTYYPAAEMESLRSRALTEP
jgi:hypothetical protein